MTSRAKTRRHGQLQNSMTTAHRHESYFADIGKTFLRLQESAASHLRSYFDQPREQFRYLAAAERLLSYHGSGDQKISRP